MKELEWFLSFEIVVGELRKLYDTHKSPSKVLYNKLVMNKDFIRLNPWIKKMRDEFELFHLDPIHIFSSFNVESQTDENRKERFDNLVESLTGKPPLVNVNFINCPTVQINQQLAVRRPDRQQEVWEQFFRVTELNSNENSLRKEDFKNFRKWDGVDFSSLTTFFFWVASDKFFPINRFINQYLMNNRIIDSPIQTYNGYVELLNRVRNNIPEQELAGSFGGFRTLYTLAHDTIRKGVIDQNSANLLRNLFPTLVARDVHSPLGRLGFRIIAIKPLTGCNEVHLGNLKKEQMYYFEKGIEIQGEQIIKQSDLLESFFDIKNDDGSSRLKLNITAIVGKNGSGKSSLTELLFRILNNLSFQAPFVGVSYLEWLEGLNSELYYVINGKLKRIRIEGESIKVKEYYLMNGKFVNNIEEGDFGQIDLENFFYSIAINQSHYSLNSLHLGEWLDGLFHKNDAYQTPLVINPMRTKGNININNENHLAHARLILLLFLPLVDESDKGLRQITDSQQVDKVSFELRKNITEEEEEIDGVGKILHGYEKVILDTIYEQYSIDRSSVNKRLNVVKHADKYLVKKAIKIADTYGHYREYIDELSSSSIEEQILSYIMALYKDSSHITLKFRQTVNYLKFKDLIPKRKNFDLDLDYISNTIRTKKFEEFLDYLPQNIEELLPPPFFDTTIYISGIESELGTTFEALSSGEQQRIHSIATILYHIKNIDSVERNVQDGIYNYQNVNLILDEIELYYHPEMQREYVQFLIDNLAKVRLQNIYSINICLITHSPYILSDIPASNILALKMGEPEELNIKTFGANIHELLKDSFFLYEGSIGEFSTNYISQLLEEINTASDKELRENQEDIVQRINHIGDEIVSSRLLQILFGKVSQNSNEALKKYYQSKLDELS